MIENLDIIRSIEIVNFDTSSKNNKYLISFRERHFEAGAHLAHFILVVQNSYSLDDAARRYSWKTGNNISPTEIGDMIKKYIDPIISDSNTKTNKQFILKVKLLSSTKVDFFSDKLKHLFRPFIATLLTLGIIITEILFFSLADLGFKVEYFDVYIISGIILLYLISSFFHELGHASASKYFGINHGEIGFGIYLYFPVLYNDVSNIWKLPRKQRLIINIAGIYFQLSLLIIYIIISLLTNNNIITFFVLTQNINLLVTLNPFFKFDGYWIVTDLLGVPNLRKRTNEVLTYIFNNIRKKTSEKPFLFTMKLKEKIFLITYMLIVNLFFVYFFLYYMPLFMIDFFKSFPPLIHQIINQLHLGVTPSFIELRIVFSQSLMLVLISFFVYRILKPVIQKMIVYITPHN